MARPRKARIEGAAAEVEEKLPDPVPGDNGAALERIAAYYKAAFPEKWAAMRLCPAEAAVSEMIADLKG